MQALIQSYIKEINNIKKRGSIWLGNFHCNNPEVVKIKIEILNTEISKLQKKSLKQDNTLNL